MSMTNGCIAVSNKDMDVIWESVAAGTPYLQCYARERRTLRLENDHGAKTKGADDAKSKILDFEFVFAIHVFDLDVLRRRRSLSLLRVGG